MLFGKLEKGGTVRVIVVTREGEKKLGFEYMAAPPKAAKGEIEADDEEREEAKAEAESSAPLIAGPKPAARKGGKVPALEGGKISTKSLPSPSRKGAKPKPSRDDDEEEA